MEIKKKEENLQMSHKWKFLQEFGWKHWLNTTIIKVPEYKNDY